jgi:hypothetical protein
MTSLAFILGVVPLAVATGAGAEMRQSLGTAVFFGMLGVTLFGLMFTPTFYTLVRRWEARLSDGQTDSGTIPFTVKSSQAMVSDEHVSRVESDWHQSRPNSK